MWTGLLSDVWHRRARRVSGGGFFDWGGGGGGLNTAPEQWGPLGHVALLWWLRQMWSEAHRTLWNTTGPPPSPNCPRICVSLRPVGRCRPGALGQGVVNSAKPQCPSGTQPPDVAPLSPTVPHGAARDVSHGQRRRAAQTDGTRQTNRWQERPESPRSRTAAMTTGARLQGPYTCRCLEPVGPVAWPFCRKLKKMMFLCPSERSGGRGGGGGGRHHKKTCVGGAQRVTRVCWQVLPGARTGLIFDPCTGTDAPLDTIAFG